MNIQRVAFTGHRNLSDGRARYVLSECRRILSRLMKEAAGQELSVYCMLAKGADSIFAKVAIELEIPLIAVLAFNGYRDYLKEAERKEFDGHFSCRHETIQLSGAPRSAQAYLDAGKWMVDRSGLLIAAWDGQPSNNPGGTASVVHYARERSLPIEIIDLGQTSDDQIVTTDQL